MKTSITGIHFFNTSFVLFVLILFQSMVFCPASIALSSDQNELVNEENDQLVVLWTTSDREVALKMIIMYTFNAKKNGWWEDIVVIVWGPSAKLLSEDLELQDKIKEMIDAGIVVKACKGCADQFEGASEKLEALGVEVLYVGKEFTDYLKSESTLLTL